MAVILLSLLVSALLYGGWSSFLRAGYWNVQAFGVTAVANAWLPWQMSTDHSINQKREKINVAFTMTHI